MTIQWFARTAPAVLIGGVALAVGVTAQAAVFTATGATPASIQTAVDNFRNALGANNGVGGSFVGGRREINWDGVPDNFASPNVLPGNFFNANSPRGVVMSTPGTSLQVSADSSNPNSTPVRFGNLDATQASQFQTFSAERLFTATGSNTVQIDFFIPGTNIPTSVAGFGAVFTDVELAGTIFTLTMGNGSNGGQFAVPVGGDGSLSFLGLTDPNRYSRIVIQFGTAAIGTPENIANGVDIVAMDDFIYGEPLNPNAGNVPAPAPLALMALGLVGAAWRSRRR